MSDMIRVMGAVQSKSGVLSHPDFFTDTPLIILRVHKDYLQSLVEWSKEHNIKELEIEIRERPVEVQERAKRFFFAVRDKIAIKTEGENATRKYKDHLYRSCIKELGIVENGKIVNSLKTLSRRDLHMATELILQWAVEAECDISDLVPEMKAIRIGLKT